MPAGSNLLFQAFSQSAASPGTYAQSVKSGASTTLLSIISAFKAGTAASLRSSASFAVSKATGVTVVAGDLIVVTSARGAGLRSVTVSDNASGGSNTYSQVGSVFEAVHYNALFQHMALAKSTGTLTITSSLLGDASDDGWMVHVISGTTGTLATVLDARSIVADGADATSHVNAGPTTSKANDFILSVWCDQPNADTILSASPATSGAFVATQTYWLRVTDTSGTFVDSSVTITPQQAAGTKVTLTPGTAQLTGGQAASFTAAVTGSTNTAVTWKVDGVANGNATVGTLSGSGSTVTYTAPATAGTHSLSATSVADPTKSASATLTLVAAPTAKSLVAASSTVAVGSATTLTPTFSAGTARIGTAGPGSSDLSASATSGTPLSTGPMSVTKTYTLTVTNAAGALATTACTITVAPAPAASLVASTTTPVYGATNVTITPTFAGGAAVLGTSQGGSDISASPVSGLAIPVAKGGFAPAASNSIFHAYSQQVAKAGPYSQTVTTPDSTTLLSMMSAFRVGSTAAVRSATAFDTAKAMGISVVAGDLIVVTSARGAGLATVKVTDNASSGSNSYAQVGSGLFEAVHYNAMFQHFAIARTTGALTITTSLLGDSYDNGCLVHVISGVSGTLATALDGRSLVGDAADGTSHVNAGLTTSNANDFILSVWCDQASAGVVTAASAGNGCTSAQTYWLRVTNLAGVFTDSSVTITPQGTGATITSVFISPPALGLSVGTQNQFSATVAGTGSFSSATTWSAQRGTVTATGLYTAPATSGTDLVSVTSVQDPTKSATATITVIAAGPVTPTITAVTVSPTSWTLSAGTQKQFTAVVSGTGTFNTNVTWSAQHGSIDIAGLYTAPASGSDVITATAIGSVIAGAASVTVTPSGATTYPGFGYQTTGGLGKPIVHVTNLNDAGPGSFRAALGSNRTIVFDVGGTISLTSENINESGLSNLTIDGTNAPGPGITFNQRGMWFRNSTNIIVKNIRHRGGYDAGPETGPNINFYPNCTNVVIDHCSFSGFNDSAINLWNNIHEVTIVDCIVGPGIVAQHNFLVLISEKCYNVTMVHNLMYGGDYRNPAVGWADNDNPDYPQAAPVLVADVVNNLVYKYGGYGTSIYWGAKANVVGNWYWSDSGGTAFEFGDPYNLAQAYCSGNVHKGSSAPYGNAGSAFPVPSAAKVTATDAATAANYVKANAGCRVGGLDATDRAMINDLVF